MLEPHAGRDLVDLEGGAGRRAPLKVSVLVTLLQRADAGGHVKVWERLAAAALGLEASLDLTVHFLGDAPGIRPLGANVRFVRHRPVFGTTRLPFLSHIPDHTDLAPHHPGLARQLAGADVIHTTDAYFAFARTAEHVARQRRVPLTSSVHTDTPRYTNVFTGETIERLLGRGPLARWVRQGLGVPRRMEARMRRRLLQHQRRCAHALVSRPDELERLACVLPRARVGLLRRGVDRELFSPLRRDRPWLEARFQIPPGRLVVLMVGRLSRGKNVMTLVEALRLLRGGPWPLHLLCAGEGDQRAAIQAALGDSVSCPGVLPPETLARAYASVDLCAHPSEIEEYPNVILEAMASGRPVIASRAGGASRFFRAVDGAAPAGLIVEHPGPEGWARALATLVGSPEERARLGGAARRTVERTVPSWRDVLTQDLLDPWLRACEERPRP